MNNCPEFERYLERLPREDISPEFEAHLQHCSGCKRKYQGVSPVVHRLAQQNIEPDLPAGLTDKLTNLAMNVRRERNNRKITYRLFAVSVFCLPLVLIINWFWGFLGFTLLETLFSQNLALIYAVSFTVAAIVLIGLAFGSLPILIGLLRRGERLKEIEGVDIV